MKSIVDSNTPRPLSRMAMGVSLALGMGLLDSHKPIHAGDMSPAMAGSVHLNGIHMNIIQLNGVMLNGTRMNELTLNGRMTVHVRTVNGTMPNTAKPMGSDSSDIKLLSKQAIVK